jgi:hypothetical protein
MIVVQENEHVFWIVNGSICQGEVTRIYSTGSVLIHKVGDTAPLVIALPRNLYATIIEVQNALMEKFYRTIT